VIILVIVIVIVIVIVRVLADPPSSFASRVSALPRPGHLEASPDVRAPLPPPEAHPQPPHPHRRHGPLDHPGGNPGVDQRGHRHVPGDPGGRLEVQVHAHAAVARFNIAAMRPAPKPLSMFMTATPEAHEFSIPSSAAIPPRLAP